MKPECARLLELPRSVFRDLEPEIYAEVAEQGSVQKYRAGETVIVPGAPVHSVCCVLSGAAKATRLGERGDRQILRLLGPADMFGLRPLLAGHDFVITVTVLEPCTVCAFPRDAVLDALRRSTRFAFRVMRYLAREIRTSEDFLMVLTQRPVRRRVADLLLLLHGHDIRGDNWEPLRVNRLKRKDMAQAIGATPETLSRVLAEFAKDGLISVNRREIKLLDLEGLQTVASDKSKAT